MKSVSYTAEKLRKLFPENDVITDRHSIPSVMVYIPMFRMCDVAEGASEAPHPAFIVNGKVLRGIYISKFQNVVSNGHTASLPDADPTTNIDYDTAAHACAEKGAGWHMMTAAEWGAIALWCRKNGHLPWGNNDLGRDCRECEIRARVTYRDPVAGICRVATGSGPVEWSHNRRADGIWDLNANVWEWVGGLRLICGELQFCDDTTERWFALDARSGKRILPDGAGTTPYSVKLDYVNGAWIYTTAVTDTLAKPRYCEFNDVSTDDTLCATVREWLIAYGLLPSHRGDDLAGVSLYANNGADERMPFRGGRWGQGVNTGVFKTCLDDPRNYAGAAVGFRCSYYEV